MNVAVIGGGYAGMAAAVTLADQGATVTVYEAAKQLGGRARRVEVHGLALDNGLHILIGAYRETLRLIEHVNPAARGTLLRLPLDWVIHQEFRLRASALPAPLHLIVGLLRARGVSLTERLSALRFMIRMRLRDYAFPADMAVSELLDRYGQSARLRRMLWHPLCVAALNTPPDKASARVFLRVLRDSLGAAREDCDLLLPKTDLTALFPEPAAAHVKARGGTVHVGFRVTAIDPCDAGFSVSVNGRQEVFSHVICALPPHQVNAFLIGISALAEIADNVERFDFQPIYSVYLRYPGNIRLPAPMLGFDSVLLHWAFDRELLCGQTGVIGVVISAEGAHQQLGQEELAQVAHRELQQRIGPLPEPLWSQVIAEKRATISCTPALRRPSQQTPLKNFFLAGDYTESDYPATLEAAVRSGIGAARLVLEKGD